MGAVAGSQGFPATALLMPSSECRWPDTAWWRFAVFVPRSDTLFVKMSGSGRLAKRRSSKFRNRRAIRQASLAVVA